nr:AP-1 complex subunit sigma-1A [Equus asinus]
MLPSRAGHQRRHLRFTSPNTSILIVAFYPVATRGRFDSSGKLLLMQSSCGFNQKLARFQSARTSLSSSPHPPTGPQGCLVTMTTELLKAEVKDLVAMASASPPPAPPARLAALRLRSTQREGPRSRGGASSEREGSRRKDKKGSGAGAYGGRRGTRRAGGCRMMRFMLLFSRQGKLRLQKWYLATSDKERKKMVRELMQVVLARKPKMCSFLEWRDLKVVYKRYASLYFCCAIEGQDNELITLELIHRYVELLDKYFGSVCELDIIFNFEKAYFILDEFLMGGDVQDTSKKSVLKAIEQADLLQEEDESPRSVLEEMGLA